MPKKSLDSRRGFLQTLKTVLAVATLEPLVGACIRADDLTKPAAPLLNVENVVIVAYGTDMSRLNIYADAKDFSHRRWFEWEAYAGATGYEINSQVNFDGLRAANQGPAFLHPTGLFRDDVPLWTATGNVKTPSSSFINKCLIDDPDGKAAYGGIQNTDGRLQLGIYNQMFDLNSAEVVNSFNSISHSPYMIRQRSYRSGRILPDINGVLTHYIDNVTVPCARMAAPITPEEMKNLVPVRSHPPTHPFPTRALRR